MVQAGERLSSVTEILSGQQSNEAERPTTTLARIEQGLKVFTSIHKRLFRAFKSEYTLLFRLNQRFLQPKAYFRILDTPMAVLRDDYNSESCDIVPVADPNETTNTQKLIRGQIWMGMKGQGFNDEEINKRFAEALQEPEPEKLLNAPPPPPPPDIMIKMEELELEKAKFQFEVVKFGAENEERQARIAKFLASAQDSLAKAESYEPGRQLELYKTHLTAIVEEFKVKNANQQARLGSVGSAAGNKGSAAGSSGAAG
jgi:hypothetical protein